MNIKRVCQFLLDKEPDKPDAKLRYRIKWDHNRCIVSRNVGYRVDIDKWSTETQRCKNNTTHGRKKVSASVINREIERFQNAAENVFVEFEKQNVVPSAGTFRSAYERMINPAKTAADKDDFFDVFEEFKKQRGIQKSWTESTYEKYNALIMQLKSFNGGLKFSDITEETLNSFIVYLQSPKALQLTQRNADRGLQNSTIKKLVTNLKSFLKWAKKRGYYNGSMDVDFSPHLKILNQKDRQIVFLTWNELQYLYNFDFAEKELSEARDVFCFCCFTSLRYSDCFNLRKEDVRNDYISVVTAKTSEGVRIELNKYSRAILERYRHRELEGGKALPVLPIQPMNEVLKKIGMRAGFNEKIRITYFVGSERHEETYPKYALLSTHAGRRTFIVNALYMGIPAEVVMTWTGHADYNAMKPYIKIVDELKQNAMSKFDDFSPSLQK